jgi:putative protease
MADASIATAPELLAPAGDWDCVRAAIANGADAVYFGLDAGFNARARAANFPLADLPRLMALLRRHGLKGYATLNTLVFSDELAEFERVAREVAAAGVDAALVQDVGGARLLRDVVPHLPLHASTQMTLTSAETIALAEELGMDRVVVARELSIDEILAIRRLTSMPLEVFVHGALCVAYSGQCLTSESLGGRSANRGQCAQACRLPYDLVCDGKDVDLGNQKYLLSPQDLAAYALTPELLAAGVSSFKIEGRLKTPEYVANITRHYRQAIDAAVAGRPVAFTPREVEEMELSFSRGFSPGWLHGCDHKMLVPATSSAKQGVRLGAVVEVRRGRVAVDLAAGLAGGVKRGDGVAFAAGATSDDAVGGRVYEVFHAGRSVVEPVTGGRVELAFGRDAVDLAAIAPGQAVWKTDDPQLTARLRRTFTGDLPLRRQPIDVHVRAAPGEPVRVVARTPSGAACEVVSAEPAREATKHPLDAATLRDQFGRLGGTPFELRGLVADIAGRPMLPFSLLGKLRHDLVAALEAAVTLPLPLGEGRGEGAGSQRTTPGTLTRPAATLSQKERGLDIPPLTQSEATLSLSQRERGLDIPALTQPEATLSLSHRERGLDIPALTQPEATLSLSQRERGLDIPALTQPEATLSLSLRERAGVRVPGVSRGRESDQPALHVLVRSLAQLRAVLDLGERSLAADFADIRQYREAVAACRAGGASLLLAPPRIQKPDELGIFHLLAKQEPDGILVRNWAGLRFFRDLGLPVVGDFSLNVTNELSAEFYATAGCTRVTASYDLNREQLLALVAATPPARLEVVIHQHMPMFHMEHCVFCAVLSPGTNKTNCGRPCDEHVVKLRDRIGVEHPLTADVGCRNTLWSAVPQSGAEVVPALLDRGVRHFRVELLDEPDAEIGRIVAAYRGLLAGRTTGREVWKALNAANRVGVTRGTLEERRNPLALL